MNREIRVARSFGYPPPTPKLPMHLQDLSDSPHLPAAVTPGSSELEMILAQAYSSSSVLKSPVLQSTKPRNTQNHGITSPSSRRLRRLRPHSSPVRLETAKLHNAQNNNITSTSSRRIHRRRPNSSPDRRKDIPRYDEYPPRSAGSPTLPVHLPKSGPLPLSAEVFPGPSELESMLSQAYSSSTGLPSPVTGYFSSRPPVMPLQLMPIKLFGNYEEDEEYQDEKPSKESSAQSMDNTVHSFLSEAAVDLPLSAFSKTTMSSPTKNIPNANNPGRGLTDSRLASSSIVSGSRTVRCNVATQVRAMKNETFTRQFCSKPSKQTDEWLGGVRALRDSHVRLVLRQLRHIDRLNRALDRVLPTQRLCSPDSLTQ